MAAGDPELGTGVEESGDGTETTSLIHRRCCFCLPCLAPPNRSRSAGWQRMGSADDDDGDRWWKRGLKKIREWSEIVAGPKWKTFIRRFNNSNGGNNGFCGGGRDSSRKPWNFQYDADSYALNFDDTALTTESSDGVQNFSSRYASTTRDSVDLGHGKANLVYDS